MAPTDRSTDRRDEPGAPRVDGSFGRAGDDDPTSPVRARSGADDEQRRPGPVDRAASWLRATPAELTGLAILLVGAVAASLLLWTGASGRPTVLTSSGGDGGAGEAGQPAATMGEVGRPAAAGEVPVAGPGDAGPDDEEPGHAAPNATAPGGPPPAGSPPVSETPGPLTVHVSGAVQRPGLVELSAGSRVGHAVEAAGGLGPGADLATVNLARPLVDGEQVHVLREGEVAPPGAQASPPAAAGGAPDPAGAAGGGTGTGGAGIDAEGRVDLNRATAEELETLPGIGPAKATAIVEHRESHGPFAEPGDIRAVSGIGEKTFQQLADRITAG